MSSAIDVHDTSSASCYRDNALTCTTRYKAQVLFFFLPGSSAAMSSLSMSNAMAETHGALPLLYTMKILATCCSDKNFADSKVSMSFAHLAQGHQCRHCP